MTTDSRTLSVQTATPMPDRAARDRALLVAGLLGFVLVFGMSVAIWGLPWSRDRVVAWLLVGLAATSLGNLRGWLRGIVRDWAPLLGVLFAYDLLRGYADGLLARAHTLPQLRFDEALFGGTAPTVTLQQALFDPAREPQWYDYAAWVTYTSHFFVPLVAAAVLWQVARPLFRRYAALFVALTMAGFATYALFPAVPPWLASQQGALEPTTRIVPVMWSFVGVEPAATIFQQGGRYANDVAAIPSLHAAYPVLLALVLWASVPLLARVALVAYPLAMGLALVYGAEHYVADILLGWVYAAAVFASWLAVNRWRRSRHLAREAPVPL